MSGLVIGVDPGASGAIALYDGTTRRLVSVEDIPVWHVLIGKTKKKRLDPIEINERIAMLKLMGAELVVIEAVGGRPGQAAAAAFSFGYSVGLLYMACVAAKIPIETTPPGTWKRVMRVPGKKDDGGEGAVQRAGELFPDMAHLFRGDRGGAKHDRAEAALLAKFGADHVLRAITLDARVSDLDAEFRLAYQRANIGA